MKKNNNRILKKIAFFVIFVLSLSLILIQCNDEGVDYFEYYDYFVPKTMFSSTTGTMTGSNQSTTNTNEQTTTSTTGELASGEDEATAINLNNDPRSTYSDEGDYKLWQFSGTHGGENADYSFTCQGVDPTGSDVVFTWTATADGSVVVGDCGINFNEDTLIFVGTSCYDMINCDDWIYCVKSNTVAPSKTFFEAKANQTYYIIYKHKDNFLGNRVHFNLEFTEKTTEYKWLVMFYLNGDNDLEKTIVNELNYLEAAGGDSSDVKVVVLLDRHPGYDHAIDGDWSETRRYHEIKHDIVDVIPSNYPAYYGVDTSVVSLYDSNDEKNMGDGQTLEDFGKWAVQTYPAEHYMLIISDHGTGWAPFKIPDVEIKPMLMSIDESSMDALQVCTHEFKNAISSIANETQSNKLDILGLNVCLTGMVEVAWEIKDYVDIMIASESIGWSGMWTHFYWFSELRNQTFQYNDPAELTRLIGDGFDMHWGILMQQISYPATMAGIDLRNIDADFTNKLNTLSNELNSNYSSYSTAINSSRNNASNYEFGDSQSATTGRSYIDLRHFCQLLNSNGSLPASVKTAALNMMNKLDDGIIFSHYFDGNNPVGKYPVQAPYDPSYGLSIETEPIYWSYYNNLDMSTDINWDSFISSASW